MSTEPLTYVNYDFDTLVTQLENRLKAQGAWKDTYRSATGQMLIELYAAIGNLVLFYVERRAEETYILTAKNRSSVINLVRLLNYVPKRKVSSTGTLRFSLSVANAKLVFIPANTSCSTEGGLKFLVSEDVVIIPGQTYVDAVGIQGELVVLDYVSTGAINQEYKVNDDSVENTSVVVVVNGVTWTVVTSFIDSTAASTHYVVRPNLDDTITVVFGDNVFGKSPEVSSTIGVTYVKSSGLSGNVYELAKIIALNDTIFDEDDDSVSVAVSNTTVFLGGDAAQDTEEIRYEAPKVFATGDRAVTKADFTAILEDYAGVANANAWGENEESPPNYTMYNQVKLVVLLQNWVLPDVAFQAVLSDYLYTKSLMTVRYSYVDPDILEVIPTMTIKAIRGSTLSYLESLIDTTLANQFTLGTTTRLGTSKRISDIVASIEAVPGVSYSYTTLKIRKQLAVDFAYPNVYGAVVTAIPLATGTVEIWVDDVQVAVDDGAGGWTALVGTVVGSVVYATGVVAALITPQPVITSVVTAKYQQDASGDVVVTKNQICKLYETKYTDISYV